jgi:hypothetical protein
MSEPKPRQVHHAEVASHIPGRLRIRLPRSSRYPHILNRIKNQLEQKQGIPEVGVNHAAGSLTVNYDHRLHKGTRIFELLEDLDVIAGTVMDVPHIDGAGSERGSNAPALTFADALNDLSNRFAALTGLNLDLKVLLPLTLAGVGVWRIAVKGLMIETIPGWLLLWFAFDAFVKLHPHVLSGGPQASMSREGTVLATEGVA